MASGREKFVHRIARRQKAAGSLGPRPEAAIAAMVDFGLTDEEIGRYYGLPVPVIIALREYWKIGRNRP